jgi:methyltransferase (TIGR00027 family)
MAKQTVSRTALGAAICRLIEQYQPTETRLFVDPVVHDLVGAPVRALMQIAFMRDLTLKQMDAITAGIYGAQVCRTRYIDEAVEAALAEGVGQLVILGAGYDTRPYRLPALEQVNVFEVDLPTVQADKKKKVQQHLGHPSAQVVFVPVDFDTQTLETALAGSTFDSARPAVFVWEGVTQYLSEAAVRQTLGFVGRAAPGSLIVFTYVLKSIIERRSNIAGADQMLDTVAKQSPWIFGLEPASLRAYLEPLNLSLVADVGNADYQAKYLRPLKRELSVFEGERVAQATVTRP